MTEPRRLRCRFRIELANLIRSKNTKQPEAPSSRHESQTEISGDNPCSRYLSLRSDVLVQKLEDVRLPDLDCRVHGVMPIFWCLTDRSVYLQEMRLVHAVKLRAQGMASSRAVIVVRLYQHDGSCCVASCGEQSLAQFS